MHGRTMESIELGLEIAADMQDSHDHYLQIGKLIDDDVLTNAMTADSWSIFGPEDAQVGISRELRESRFELRAV